MFFFTLFSIVSASFFITDRLHAANLAEYKDQDQLLNQAKECLAEFEVSLNNHMRQFLNDTKSFSRFFYPSKSGLNQHLSLYGRNLIMVQVSLAGVKARLEQQLETDRLFSLLRWILTQWLFAQSANWREPETGISLWSCLQNNLMDPSLWLRFLANHLQRARLALEQDSKSHLNRQAKQQVIVAGKLVRLMHLTSLLYGSQDCSFTSEELLASMANGALVLLRKVPDFNAKDASAVAYEICSGVEQLAIFIYNTQMPKSELAMEVISIYRNRILGIIGSTHSALLVEIEAARVKRLQEKRISAEMDEARRSELQKSLIAMEKEEEGKKQEMTKKSTTVYNGRLGDSEGEEEEKEETEDEHHEILEIPAVSEAIPDTPLLYQAFALVQWAQECRRSIMLPLRKKAYPQGQPVSWSWAQVIELTDQESNPTVKQCLSILQKRDQLVHGSQLLRLIANVKNAHAAVSDSLGRYRNQLRALLSVHPHADDQDQSLSPFAMQGLPSLDLIRQRITFIALHNLCELLPAKHCFLTLCAAIKDKRDQAAHPPLIKDAAVMNLLWKLIR